MLPGGGGGGVGIPCLGKSESINSGATKPVPFLNTEGTNYAALAKVAHEKQWKVAVIFLENSPGSSTSTLTLSVGCNRNTTNEEGLLQHFCTFHGKLILTFLSTVQMSKGTA